MRIPLFIVTAMLGVMLSVQAWTLLTVIELKVKLASLETQMMFTNHITQKAP